MKALNIGVRVRYIGGQDKYVNALLYALIGRTGVITSRSFVEGMDWAVEMDTGCLDIDAKAEALEPIDDEHADNFADERQIELT